MAANQDPALWPTRAWRRDRSTRALLAHAQAALAGLQVPWRIQLNQDPPTTALREAACRQHADLIVVGASAGGWHRLLTDHVGATLARSVPAPTLIVP